MREAQGSVLSHKQMIDSSWVENFPAACEHLWVILVTQSGSLLPVTVSPPRPEAVKHGSTLRLSKELFQNNDAQTPPQMK